MKLQELFILLERKYGRKDVLIDKEGNEFTIQREDYVDQEGKDRIAYEVRELDKPPGTWVIAGVTMSAIKPKQAMSLFVRPEHRRKGIASAIYSYIEKDLNITMEPNWALTDDGEAFWAARKKQK